MARNSVGRAGHATTGCGAEQRADARRALGAGDGGRVEPLGVHDVEDVAEGAQDDAVLAERGQHALDVGRVGARGADDEDAAGLEAAPVGVEQVGRPVQGDDGLAGAGAARDLGDAAGAGADRLVLVGLDRRDDVAHALAAAAGQGRHERAVADDDEVVGRLGDHEVVLDADDDRGPRLRRTRRRRTPIGCVGVAR